MGTRIQWTTGLGLAVFISVPLARVSSIPYASPISGDTHKDQLLLLFRYHFVTPFYSPGRKVSPRARNDAKKECYSEKGCLLNLSSSKTSQRKQAAHFENEWINQPTNKPSEPRQKGGEIARALAFYSCCSLPSPCLEMAQVTKHPLTKKGPTWSTSWHVQKSIPIQHPV